MKKFLFILFFTMFIFTGCARNDYIIVGDEYVVTSVENFDSVYGTKYKVVAKPVNQKANHYTLCGNRMEHYTNSLYCVNDTILICKKNKICK